MQSLSRFIIDLMSDAIDDNLYVAESKRLTTDRIRKIEDVLIHHPDEFDYEEIAQMANVSTSTVNRIANNLHSQGHIAKPVKPWSPQRPYKPIESSDVEDNTFEPEDYVDDGFESENYADTDDEYPSDNEFEPEDYTVDGEYIDDDEFEPEPVFKKPFKPRHLIKQAKPTTMASFMRRRRNLPEDVQKEIYWMIHAKEIIDW